MLRIKEVRMDYEKKLMAVTQIPQFSWVIESDRPATLQTGYQLQISRADDFGDLVYDSGQKTAEDSAHVIPTISGYQPLVPYFARVRIWDNYGRSSEWSGTADFLFALPEGYRWKARFVSAESAVQAESSAGTYIRKEFTLKDKVNRAWAMVSALGLYEFYLNGGKVGDAELTPGWTAYEKQLLYQTWDVTDRLRPGKNAAAAVIGAGWYKGRIGESGRCLYGEQTAFFMELHIHYENGTDEIWCTDEFWKGCPSPVRMAELYDGETYDARLEIPGFNRPGLSEEGWNPVCELDYPVPNLYPQKAALVRKQEIFPVKKIFRTPDGITCLDFGQNMAGIPGFRVQGKPGDLVELQCFEELDKEGNVYTDNLRSARQTIRYFCRGEGPEEHEPLFTYQGFRYVAVLCWPGEIVPEQFRAVAMYSSIDYTGTFRCGNPLLNRLVQNIRWSMKSNFVDIPTDCPQRDERLGWTGDAQIFCQTSAYLGNVYNFFEKWLRDLSLEQNEEGGVPHLIPDILCGRDQSDDWLLSQGIHSAAAWADAAVLIPWKLYLHYADRRILERQYAGMKSWIDFMTAHAENGIWNYQLQFGDWLALDAKEGSYFGATPNELTCTAYYAYSTGIFARVADILEHREDAVKYQKLYEEIRSVFKTNFFGPDGMMTADTQTAYALALCFDLVPDQWKTGAADRLAGLLEQNDGHMTTGFMGTPCLCPALSAQEKTKEAYRLLLRTDYPSWLYQVSQGATTVWEHLDGKKPDGNMWSADMNSFNHYAYGAVGEWLFETAAGIRICEENPGFRRILICPEICEELGNVEASCSSPYGDIEVRWECEEDQVTLEVQIPHNTTAQIRLNNVTELIEAKGCSRQKANFRTKNEVIKEAGGSKEKAERIDLEAGSGVHRIQYRVSQI